jgi:hypothetical protein
VAKFKAELMADPEKADAFYKEAGILTPTGRLARRYGGR